MKVKKTHKVYKVAGIGWLKKLAGPTRERGRSRFLFVAAAHADHIHIEANVGEESDQELLGIARFLLDLHSQELYSASTWNYGSTSIEYCKLKTVSKQCKRAVLAAL